MALNLTQKERTLLEDQKNHEEVCIKKYTNYANNAQDQQLKQLFNTLASQEQQHLNTINQLLSGQIPNTSSQQQNQQGVNQIQLQPGMQANTMQNQNDAILCNDMLMTEKYVSSTYDQTIFEQTNGNVRQILNHIQKEEQQHGEQIYNYMKNMGMYNAK